MTKEYRGGACALVAPFAALTMHCGPSRTIGDDTSSLGPFRPDVHTVDDAFQLSVVLFAAVLPAFSGEKRLWELWVVRHSHQSSDGSSQLLINVNISPTVHSSDPVAEKRPFHFLAVPPVGGLRSRVRTRMPAAVRALSDCPVSAYQSRDLANQRYQWWK